MEARLTKEVSRLRNQVMSFTNEGAEFSLNCPDTNEVKECMQENVIVLVQCQKQISTLQQTVTNMAEDHVKAQEALIAWSTDCINGLATQNKELALKLIETQKQMADMAYNIQGYVDENAFGKVILPEFDQTPPGLYKTVTPKVITDAKEVGDSDDTSTLFPTATGAEIEPSFRKPNPNARSGGSITLQAKESVEDVFKPHRKSDDERAEALNMYQSVTHVICPTTPRGRWLWSYRKIRMSNRLMNLKVDMTRGKLPTHDTIQARMKRAEVDLFFQPIHMKDHVSNETMK